MKNTKKLLLFLILTVGSKICLGQDWANLQHYRYSNERLKSSKITVVYIGDSITDFWVSKSPDFFSESGYVDRGISGQTSPQMVLRFRQDVIDLKPKTVILLCGTNDIAGDTGPSTLEMIENNIMSMSELAKINKITMILCSVLPASHFYWSPDINPADSIISLNQWIKAYAKQQQLPYVDYYSAMVDEKKGSKKEYSEDGVHPNNTGYTVMEQIVTKIIKATL